LPSSTLFPYTTLFRSLAWPRYRDVLDTPIDRATNGAVPCVLGSRLYRRPRSNRLSGLHGSATRAVFRGDRSGAGGRTRFRTLARSEEHTSELQSLTNL